MAGKIKCGAKDRGHDHEKPNAAAAKAKKG